MSTVLGIFAGILFALVIVLIAAYFMKRNHYTECHIVINQPAAEVFNFLRFLKNQDKFNKWAAADPNRVWHEKGVDGEVGYILSWSGNKKAGIGEKEITSITENECIETQIRFLEPMKVTADVIMLTQALSEHQCKVSLINKGELNYPMNVFIPFAERNFPKDLNESLQKLKLLLES